MTPCLMGVPLCQRGGTLLRGTSECLPGGAGKARAGGDGVLAAADGHAAVGGVGALDALAVAGLVAMQLAGWVACEVAGSRWRGQQASLPQADKIARATYLRWPRVSVLELGAFRDAVQCARRHLRGALGSGASHSA